MLRDLSRKVIPLRLHLPPSPLILVVNNTTTGTVGMTGIKVTRETGMMRGMTGEATSNSMPATILVDEEAAVTASSVDEIAVADAATGISRHTRADLRSSHSGSRTTIRTATTSISSRLLSSSRMLIGSRDTIRLTGSKPRSSGNSDQSSNLQPDDHVEASSCRSRLHSRHTWWNNRQLVLLPLLKTLLWLTTKKWRRFSTNIRKTSERVEDYWTSISFLLSQ